MGVLLSCYRQGNLRASSDHDSEARFFVGLERGFRWNGEGRRRSAMRSGWNRLVWTAIAGALAVGLWAQGAGAAEVKNVKAEYAWPWGAEIRYEVVGTLDANAPLAVTVTDRAGNVSYTAELSALSGDTGSNAGSHRLM